MWQALLLSNRELGPMFMSTEITMKNLTRFGGHILAGRESHV